MKALAEFTNPCPGDDTGGLEVNRLAELQFSPGLEDELFDTTLYNPGLGSVDPGARPAQDLGSDTMAMNEPTTSQLIDSRPGNAFKSFDPVFFGKEHGASIPRADQLPASGQFVARVEQGMVWWPAAGHDESSQDAKKGLSPRVRGYASQLEFTRWWRLYDHGRTALDTSSRRRASTYWVPSQSQDALRYFEELQLKSFGPTSHAMAQFTALKGQGTGEAALRAELESYGNLRDNWDGEGATAPPMQAARDALAFLDHRPSGVPLPLPEVATVGDIGVYWDDGDTFVEVQFGGDRAYSYFAHRKVDGRVEEYGDDGVSVRDGWPAPVVEFLRTLKS